MLGFAVGGLIVRRRVDRLGTPGGSVDLSRLSIAAAAAVVLALLVVVRLPIDPTRLFGSPLDALMLFLTGLLLATPFVLLGTLICAALDAGKDRIGLLYGSTFLGGAAGAAACLIGMEALGAPATSGLLALLPLLVCLRSINRAGYWAAAILVVATVLAPSVVLPLQSRKHFPRIPDAAVRERQWNSFSRVTFYDNPDRHGLWEVGKRSGLKLPRSIGVAIDEWAITSILEAEDGPGNLRFLDHYPPTIAFEGAAPGFDALVIGAGGGVDVHAALHAGAGHVTAVEINPLIVNAVRGRYDAFSGGLYRDERVEVRIGEGRHFIETTEQSFDRIVLSGVDTFAATEAGAFALSENYLYTVEAIQAFYQRLRPGGILFLARWWFEPPRQTLRLTVTATEALAELGVEDLSDRVIIARAQYNSLFLLKNGEFEPAERQQILAGLAQRGATLIHPTAAGPPSAFSRALTSNGSRDVVDNHPLRVDATRDDRPFFFENSTVDQLFRSEGDWIHGRLGGLELLVVTLVILLILSLPLYFAGGGDRSTGRGQRLLSGLPFLCLGFAYLFVEIPLMQRLSLVLGHPVRAVAVVLVAMLVGSGLGAILARRLAPEQAWRAAAAAAGAVVAVPVLSHVILLDAVRGAGDSERVLAVCGFLALPSVVMGMPFPLAIRHLSRHGATLVPTAFTANGLASVLAGPLAVLLAMATGFRFVLLAAAGCYLLAALLLFHLGRQGSSESVAMAAERAPVDSQEPGSA